MENKKEEFTTVEEHIENESNALNVTTDTDKKEEHHHHHHHHHSHYGHSRGSRKKSKRNNKKQNKVLKFFRKNIYIIIAILSTLVSVALLIVLAYSFDKSHGNNADPDNIIDITNSSLKIESSIYTEDVPLVHKSILAYVDENNDRKASAIHAEYDGKRQKINIGLPLRYEYSVLGIPTGLTLKTAHLEISANSDFTKARSYLLSDSAGAVNVYHLLPGTKYYYRLNVILSNETSITTSGEFVTVDSPRVLSVDGIINVRDIGGWETSYGKKIKYGLLYRGSELDGSVEPTYCLTEQGRDDMISVLGIRLDMDLRPESEAKGDPLGANVKHKNYGAGMYGGIFSEENQEIYRRIFSDLANADNYPIYLHCTYGRDRTGTVCYLLEALLGVSDKDLYKEYDLSSLSYYSAGMEDFAAFTTRISMLEGDTTKDKVEGYLLSIGVTPQEIANIREIFLED